MDTSDARTLVKNYLESRHRKSVTIIHFTGDGTHYACQYKIENGPTALFHCTITNGRVDETKRKQ